MRTSEVARALAIPLRSYEHLEAGRGRISFSKLVRFAAVTNSDPLAIIAALSLRSPEFALRCADNKFMTIVMATIGDLNRDLAEDISLLEPGIIIGAFSRVMKDLHEHVAKRDLFAENWLKEHSASVQGARLGSSPRLKPRGSGS